MRLNFASILAAAIVLAACSTTSEETADTSGDAEVAATTPSAPATTVESVPEGPIPGSQADLTANVGDRVFFEFDKFALQLDARSTIERWAAWLKTYPNVAVTIEGHADERGTREYNLALGERRANSALEYMVSLGIDPNRVRVISYGKERPAVVGSNEAAYSQNRRSVMLVQ